ncbi:MAG: hypothetical protein FWC19_09600 [Treponema sp.]|nr:hypothetical protein [Treponema sp.]MCL2273039.1 hypothetical protein [Treponema sp.]
MQIIWDKEKNQKLIAERGLSLEIFASLIMEEKYLAVLENKSRPEQQIFVISFQGYTYAVPFIFDVNENIVLKTVFPSRKYHKIYGGKNEDCSR